MHKIWGLTTFAWAVEMALLEPEGPHVAAIAPFMRLPTSSQTNFGTHSTNLFTSSTSFHPPSSMRFTLSLP